ncbi:TetR/AcrR family transcriptional regulator [Metabacillus sp. GX 13764]|uniref:TetR/AcrR family transcriptional regulator n=1 Tax=Metabacillus kandeliae TaxID=2900151 RepID=UPI001E3ADC14|nr:TetR/AcrR family transcriptional regulator [Metabacillus kandeliae]MCD7034003.1 TetR/AcrR family transcriptional regulator [Metabacillus kandeliae]
MDGNDKKTRITAAATKLFSANGVRNTTIGEIAKTAGIGKGTIYYYYNDKTEILLDCYMKHIKVTRQRAFERSSEEKDLLFRIEKFLRYISEEARHDPFVATLVAEYREYRLAEIDLCFKHSEEDAVQILSAMVKSGIEQGSLSDVPLPLTAFLLVRMMLAYNLDYQKNEKSDEEFLSLLKNMLEKKQDC